ncbi:MAG: hypothetical protein ACKOA9_04030 [Actinomycetota bacterium]
MSTRMERRQSRHRVRRARWTGIAVGAGASVVLGLGAAGALPGVSMGTPPAESPATTVTLPAQAQPATPVSPQAKAPAVTPGSVGAAASAAGAGNATTNPAGTVPGAANAAAKSANADSAATPAAPSSGGSPATPLGPSSTDTGTSRAAAQVGNPNAQAALAASAARATAAGTPRSSRTGRTSPNGRAWAWGAAPRGTNQLTVSGCLGTSDPVTVTPEVCTGIEGNLAVHLVVPSSGEAMTSGSVSFTLPSGITLDSLTPTTSTGSEGTGAGTCSYSGSVTVSNDVVTISGITCTQDAGFVWYFGATVGSAPGTYTLSGGYRTDDQPRSATNVYRWPTELTVTVA